ncbi:[protein-PII] uridylyltransferase [Cryptosporangium aurantiacum]|uniref:Bifunctional uridylyltransferase/uridylyl-removing enzyme n=1 Tax=Cryptosporangium aurantiacum TaxID=134849 RepID=A0A1M7HUW0_9ACTN|nr:[protein-PII] uridylyltransferase [Cryptosporangium aurantiacum]SHM32133.1 [protein-PII] uridylyltransferase [Cryptosporangium aurantiacum]
MPSDRQNGSLNGPAGSNDPAGREAPDVRAPFGVGGPPSRAQLSDALDRWLAGLLPPVAGVALVAVGSLGRREVVAHSDVDLVLLHTGHPRISEIAESVWYPIWDSAVGLDHAVRTVDEAVAVARTDVKAALGLLDARYVAGDRALADELAAAVRAAWRASPAGWLGELRELTEARWRTAGELAFLLEPDLKEARGGIRDAVTLRALAYAQLVDAPRGSVRDAYRLLLDTRDALHRTSDRALDRLLLAEQDAVAEALNYADADALLHAVADAARTIAYASDTAWRQVDGLLSKRRRWPIRRRSTVNRRPLAEGVVEQNGEVVLARGVDPALDPVLPLRFAAAAAVANIPPGRSALERLATAAPPLPDVWPETAVHSLVALLGAGEAAIGVWEACDRHGMVEKWLPEWGRVRSLPQRNALHRYTVDRHLVAAAVAAAPLTRRVARPDLLLIGALLHDIGKGLPGDHSEVGAEIASRIAVRLGLAGEDTDALVRLVRYHLLLADTATRRDLDDPATLEVVAEAVRHDGVLLDVLHALTEADAAATGPAAWSGWKAGLVSDLVRRVHVLIGQGTPPTPRPRPAEVFAATDPLPAPGECTVTVHGDEVAVVGGEGVQQLLSRTAGICALHRLDVYAADAGTFDGRPVVVVRASPRFGRLPDPTLLTADLRRAVAGNYDVSSALARREAEARENTTVAPPQVSWVPDASSNATVLELRAEDRRGLLHDVTAALEEAGAVVRGARISTFGSAVVDAFYLIGSDLEQDEITKAVLAAAQN